MIGNIGIVANMAVDIVVHISALDVLHNLDSVVDNIGFDYFRLMHLHKLLVRLWMLTYALGCRMVSMSLSSKLR